MQVFKSTHLNQRVGETLTSLKRLMGFQREPLLHLLHLLMKEIQVKEKGINLVLNIFLLIMQSMINSHICMGKELLVKEFISTILHLCPMQCDFLKQPFGPFLMEFPPFSKDKGKLLHAITSSSEFHFHPFKLHWIHNEGVSVMKLFLRVAYDFHFPLIYKGCVPFGTFHLLYEVFQTQRFIQDPFFGSR